MIAQVRVCVKYIALSVLPIDNSGAIVYHGGMENKITRTMVKDILEVSKQASYPVVPDLEDVETVLSRLDDKARQLFLEADETSAKAQRIRDKVTALRAYYNVEAKA
jgi:hypothetical protein